MAAHKKQLSLDTNFVLDLGADKKFAHDFSEIFQRKGYALVALVGQSLSQSGIAQ